MHAKLWSDGRTPTRQGFTLLILRGNAVEIFLLGPGDYRRRLAGSLFSAPIEQQIVFAMGVDRHINSSGKSPAAAGSSSSIVGLLRARGCSQFHGKKRKGNGRKERPCPEVAGNEAFPRRKHEERQQQSNRDPGHHRPTSEIEREPNRRGDSSKNLDKIRDKAAQHCH
jgi:hypothetical protein